MRKIVLFIATSLDGYIAGPNEEIDWLFTDGDYGYKAFYDSIDTTLCGRKTYELARSFDPQVYPGKKNFVFTRNLNLKDTSHASFVSGNIVGFTEQLKQQKGKDIWLVGGGQVNTILLNAGLIDEMIVSIHPTILGKGIPLFGKGAKMTHFKTISAENYPSGLVQIRLSAAW